MVATSVLMSLVTLAGSFVSPHPYGAIGAVFVLAFGLALVAPTSPAATTIAIQTTAVFIVISGIAATSSNPWGNAAMVLGGGLFQTLLLSISRPAFAIQPERKAVAAVFTSLADFVRDQADAEMGLPTTTPYLEAWDLVEQSARYIPNLEYRVLKGAMDAAEALRAALVGFAKANASIRSLGGESRDQAQFAASEIELAFRRVAEALGTNRPLAEAVTLHHRELPTTEADADAAREQARWTDLIYDILAELPDSTEGPFAAAPRTPKRPTWLLGLVRRFHALRDSVDLRSLSAKHALRYALAIAAAVAISHAWSITRAYWLPLTVCLVLRLDYASTLERGFARLIGTILGVIFAGGLADVLHPSPVGLAIMTIGGAWLALILYSVNYAYFSFAVTIYVISSISASGLHRRDAVFERVAATVLGAMIAITTSVIWPIWQSHQVRGILIDALRAQIRYGEALLAGDGEDSLEEFRQSARTMRYEAERITSSAEQEPFWSRAHLPKTTRDVLGKLHENAANLLVLHAETMQRTFGRPTDLSEHLKHAADIVASDRQMEESLG
jgi:uncharacterized membrane protein YccC